VTVHRLRHEIKHRHMARSLLDNIDVTAALEAQPPPAPVPWRTAAVCWIS
jgi:hypothetical protein